mmetsp:Transcript_19715/g.19819  ORF Transcript_19715/g.19819 Transcript_19715/m.19819 type:complete len:223 (-) Transcript_19715:84-752(-)
MDSARDFSGEASGLFGSYRIPAMLVAGAAYGGMFALPLNADDSMLAQISKRTYILIGIITVVSELITTITATLSIDKISFRGSSTDKMLLTKSLEDFMSENMDLEWTALQANFILGLLGFTTMCGMRAWLCLGCPKFAKASLLLVVSAVIFMSALIDETLQHLNLMTLFSHYIVLISIKVMEGKMMYIIFSFSIIYTLSYVSYAYLHVVEYLTHRVSKLTKD